MTTERVGRLNDLLEKVWRNAREPRPTFLDFWDRPPGKRPPRMARPKLGQSRESLANVRDPSQEFDAFMSQPLAAREDAPPPTAPGARPPLLAFNDEATFTGDAAKAETLALLEQEAAIRGPAAVATTSSIPNAPAAASRSQAPRAERPATEPPPTPRGAPDIQDDDSVSLILDDIDLTPAPQPKQLVMVRPQAAADARARSSEAPPRAEATSGRSPTTQPPPAASTAPPPPRAESGGEAASADLELPDVDAIEEAASIHIIPNSRATLTNEVALERARAESMRPGALEAVSKTTEPPQPRAAFDARSQEDVDEDRAPSSERKPVDLDRPEDVAFGGFGVVRPPSEPPPESGEVPSQRRVASPHPPVPRAPTSAPGLVSSRPDDEAGYSVDVQVESVTEIEVAREIERAALDEPHDEEEEEAAAPAASRGATLNDRGIPRLNVDEEVDDDELDGHTQLFTREPSEAPAAAVRDDEPADEPDDDADDEPSSDRARTTDPLASSTRYASDAGGDEISGDEAELLEDGTDFEATKEIRSLGTVDVIERNAIAATEVIVLSDNRPKTPSTFGEIVDAALSF